MKEYKYSINGNEYTVAVIDLDGNTAAVEVNGTSYKVDILGEELNITPRPAAKPAAPAAPVAPAPQPQAAAPAPVAQTAPAEQPAAPAPAQPAGNGKPILSPLPGVILDLKVNVGDQVKAGQTVAVLEAMKMENNINAEHDGVVTAIKVNKGDSILEGAEILLIG